MKTIPGRKIDVTILVGRNKNTGVGYLQIENQKIGENQPVKKIDPRMGVKYTMLENLLRILELIRQLEKLLRKILVGMLVEKTGVVN